MQQMNLIKYDQPDELRVRPLASLPSDDVPLLGGAHDDLGLGDLLPAQLVVTSQFRDGQMILGEPFAETTHHLLH